MSQHTAGYDVLARWSLDDLDALHTLTGLGAEWRESDRRAELAARAIPPAEGGTAHE